MKIIAIGAGGGLTYSMSGPTHHALDDIGLALLIPNLLVFSPAGPRELTQTLYKSIEESGSSYIQIGKFGEKDIHFSDDLEKNNTDKTAQTELKGVSLNSEQEYTYNMAQKRMLKITFSDVLVINFQSRGNIRYFTLIDFE